MDEKIRKKIDDDWKNRVEKEKEDAKSKGKKAHQPTFTVFLSSLSMQAMIALGKLENPLSGKREENDEQARFLIDTLGIIKDKTKGNLLPEEERLLNDSLFNLRMIYVEKKREGGNNG